LRKGAETSGREKHTKKLENNLGGKKPLQGAPQHIHPHVLAILGKKVVGRVEGENGEHGKTPVKDRRKKEGGQVRNQTPPGPGGISQTLLPMLSVKVHTGGENSIAEEEGAQLMHS